MTSFATRSLPTAPTAIAPDGSTVRTLVALEAGSMACFELGPGRTSAAIVHRTVDELWYILGGRGEMWRSQDGRVEIMQLGAGTSLSIPLGTAFQFRSFGPEPLTAVGVTMPPWPGDDEAIAVVGPWQATPPEALGTRGMNGG